MLKKKKKSSRFVIPEGYEPTKAMNMATHIMLPDGNRYGLSGGLYEVNTNGFIKDEFNDNLGYISVAQESQFKFYVDRSRDDEAKAKKSGAEAMFSKLIGSIKGAN